MKIESFPIDMPYEERLAHIEGYYRYLMCGHVEEYNNLALVPMGHERVDHNSRDAYALNRE